MNGHDDLLALTPYELQGKDYDEEGNIIESDDDEPTRFGNPIIDRDVEEIQHHEAELAHNELMNMMSYDEGDR